MVTGDMLCLEDGDRARQIFAANNSKYHTGLVFKYLDSFPRPEGFPVWPDLPPDPTMEELREGANAAASCVGDPDEISRTVQKFIDIGADQLTFSSTVCDYDMDVLRESYELFGTHRHPEVRHRPGALHHPPARGPVRRLLRHPLSATATRRLPRQARAESARLCLGSRRVSRRWG